MGKNSVGYSMVKNESHNFDLRGYTEADFPMVEKWWRVHHGNDFRKGYLPKYSYVVTKNNVDSAFFGMAHMTPDICYLCYPMVNPNLLKNEREGVLDYLIECSKLWAAKTGHKIVYISIRGEKFLNRLGEAGFIEAESGNTHMFCKVGDIS